MNSIPQLIKIGDRFFNPAHIISITPCQECVGYQKNSTAEHLVPALLMVTSSDTEYGMMFALDTPEGQDLLAWAERLSAPESPSLPDSCADELAKHLAEQTFLNGTLIQERSALLDLLTRVYLNRKQIDDELEIALCETLVKAGRL